MVIVNCTDLDFDSLGKYADESVMIGSYACNNYFAKLLYYLNDNNVNFISFDLVIPILSESNISILTSDIFYKIICKARQIVVNDYGTLKLLSSCNYSCRLGRLLFRQYRDSRYSEVENCCHEIDFYRIISVLLSQGCKVSSIEIDLISTDMDIDSNLEVYIHYPYRLLSVTRICEFCGIINENIVDFSPDRQCGFQCFNTCIKIADTQCIKKGKVVYEKLSDEYQRLCVGKNIIMMETNYENNGSFIPKV